MFNNQYILTDKKIKAPSASNSYRMGDYNLFTSKEIRVYTSENNKLTLIGYTFHCYSSKTEQEIVDYLSSDSLLVIRFEFPYMQQRRRGKKLFPDKMNKLSEYYLSIIKTIKNKYANKNIWIGGKSLGGRVACSVSREIKVRGVVVFGYPFHPQNNNNNLRVQALIDEGPPILICQGTRDKLGSQEEINNYKLNKNVKICFLQGGDHSFQSLKKHKFTKNE